ncbi:hypothetical protein EI94DRAFT_1705647 [Lactarius quietus]|nr:hypothetical protein EI94DRAFT_1705647 [Lactarius quietus]
MYQQEYASQKQVPGHRKVSKAECEILEEQHMKKCQLMKMEDMPADPSAVLGHGWIDQFQNHIETFIQEHLTEAAAIMTLPGTAEEDIVHLHSLRHLVASAVQEEELVWQPEYASTCAKLDWENIWDG